MIFLDKTNGFIKEIIQPTSVNPDHRMFLISTVYMKARVHQTDASWRLKRVRSSVNPGESKLDSWGIDQYKTRPLLFQKRPNSWLHKGF